MHNLFNVTGNETDSAETLLMKTSEKLMCESNVNSSYNDSRRPKRLVSQDWHYGAENILTVKSIFREQTNLLLFLFLFFFPRTASWCSLQWMQ